LKSNSDQSNFFHSFLELGIIVFSFRESIDEVVLTKRRLFYENEIEENGRNYDNWFDYIALEENSNDPDKVMRMRELYERAIITIPPIKLKKYWRRYIYIWINYAIFEEMEGFPSRAQEVYENALKIIPHSIFTFSKLWILYAHFQIRKKDLDFARVVFGNAIGKCPREKVKIKTIKIFRFSKLILI
jgi:crooked neck